MEDRLNITYSRVSTSVSDGDWLPSGNRGGSRGESKLLGLRDGHGGHGGTDEQSLEEMHFDIATSGN